MAVVVVPVLNEKLLLVLLADRKEAERKGLELNDSLGGAESDKDVKGITARGRCDTPESRVPCCVPLCCADGLGKGRGRWECLSPPE